ncbi:MSRB1 reductase, partial [Polyodon spathula]|nr:MSRB1 reductase [Polyodon spathula]
MTDALRVSCGKCGNGLGHGFLSDGPQHGQSRF